MYPRPHLNRFTAMRPALCHLGDPSITGEPLFRTPWSPHDLAQGRRRSLGPDWTPIVRSLARKLAFTCRLTASLLRNLALGVRFSQAWKPDRDTPIALHSHATGQIFRCFAMKTNSMSLPSQRRLGPF